MDFLKALSESRRELFSEALDLLAAKLVEDEAAIGVEFPYVTEPDGAFIESTPMNAQSLTPL